jgi:glycosyltransferase involved in cell wall biosynthesis
MKKQKKLLFINTKQGFFGGVEKYIHTTSNALKNDGYQLYGIFEEETTNLANFNNCFEKIFIFNPKTISKDISELKELGVNTAFVHKVSNNRLLESIIENFKVLSFIHDHDYYCFRKHKYFPITRKNCSYAMNPVYCSLCCGFVEKKNGYLQTISIKEKLNILNSIKKSSFIITISDHMVKNLEKNGFEKHKIKKLYPIIQSITSENKPDNNSNNILFIGQIIRGKGLDLLLKAIQKIQIPFNLDIVGAGNDLDYIQTHIKKLKLTNKVRIHGWQNNPSSFYDKSNIVIVPSRWQEPFGLIGIEALSHKKPVIAFDVGGISEWLINTEYGYLIQPFKLDKMAETIQALLLDKEKQIILGTNGFNYVKDTYSENKFITAFNKLFEEIHV